MAATPHGCSSRRDHNEVSALQAISSSVTRLTTEMLICAGAGLLKECRMVESYSTERLPSPSTATWNGTQSRRWCRTVAHRIEPRAKPVGVQREGRTNLR
jgi:hypothetical protein